MAMNLLPSGISVLLLFNLDPSWLPEERKQALDVTLQLKQAMSGIGYRTVLVPITDQNLDSVLSGYDPLEHIVFNWCESLPGVPHGEWFVAEYLEQRGFTFTGAGSDIITLSQNKHLIKQLLEESGIPTPAWQMYNSKSPVRWGRFPAIVKPAREHCSEGIDRNAIVMTEAELKSRVAYILEKFGQPVLVEDFIDGRELHVSLWGNGDVCMLPPAEMEFSSLRDAHDRICSYEAKFVPDSEQYQKIETVLPAKLSEDELYEVEQVCKKAYMVTGCRDYARIDMRIKDGLLYVIDINPNSDISPDTTTIAAAELAGYTYGEFGGNIIDMALRRHPIWGEPVPENEPDDVVYVSRRSYK